MAKNTEPSLLSKAALLLLPLWCASPVLGQNEVIGSINGAASYGTDALPLQPAMFPGSRAIETVLGRLSRVAMSARAPAALRPLRHWSGQRDRGRDEIPGTLVRAFARSWYRHSLGEGETYAGRIRLASLRNPNDEQFLEAVHKEDFEALLADGANLAAEEFERMPGFMELGRMRVSRRTLSQLRRDAAELYGGYDWAVSDELREASRRVSASLDSLSRALPSSVEFGSEARILPADDLPPRKQPQSSRLLPAHSNAAAAAAARSAPPAVQGPH